MNFEESRRIAQSMPVYTGDDTYKAVRSSMRACAASERYLEAMKAATRTDGDTND